MNTIELHNGSINYKNFSVKDILLCNLSYDEVMLVSSTEESFVYTHCSVVLDACSFDSIRSSQISSMMSSRFISKGVSELC